MSQTERKTALVTGASSGVGAQVAVDLSRDHHVLAIGRNSAALEKVADRQDIEPIVADLTDPGARAAICDRLDGLDVLVHSAAVGEPGRLDKIDATEWQRQLDINVIAVAELTRLALPALRRSHGTIVFINSGSGLRSSADSPVYGATKHALRALADSTRLAVASSLVRVTSLYPGPIDTPMQHVLRDGLGEPYYAERYLSPQVLASAVRFAVDASPEADVTEIHLRPRSEAAPPPPGFDWSSLHEE